MTYPLTHHSLTCSVRCLPESHYMIFLLLPLFFGKVVIVALQLMGYHPLSFSHNTQPLCPLSFSLLSIAASFSLFVLCASVLFILEMCCKPRRHIPRFDLMLITLERTTTEKKNNNIDSDIDVDVAWFWEWQGGVYATDDIAIFPIFLLSAGHAAMCVVWVLSTHSYITPRACVCICVIR